MWQGGPYGEPRTWRGSPGAPPTEEAVMHPYIARNLAAARGRELRTQAAVALRANLVRRARRSPRSGTPAWA
jgi:hypothetical protein